MDDHFKKKFGLSELRCSKGITGSVRGRIRSPGKYPTAFIRKAVLSLTFCLIRQRASSIAANEAEILQTLIALMFSPDETPEQFHLGHQ